MMNKWILMVFFAGFNFHNGYSQTEFAYAASEMHPFGLPNPAAPENITDYQEMIGTCECVSTSRKPDGSWNAPQSIFWTFKYIMNGMAVQDETYKPDGIHTGSIRLFSADSAKWFVHYYTLATTPPTLPTWSGNRQGNEIILYNRQKAPNGTDGYYKIRFYEISETGFRWLGVWTSLDETFTYETWKIDCVKQS